MRDLLSAGAELAVLVRPSRKSSAELRVEAAMRVWDDLLGTQLPRPVVLSGDINRPDLGLSTTEIQWAAENCSTIIHNAASLSFVSTGRDAEPWRSNVDGTKNVLDFCHEAGIRKFHHVSTAYVAGLRQGMVYENEVNVGQEFANPYEESKIMAEEMVRSAPEIDSLTVFRPAIIVGDSKTGLTFTYHNFYAALELAYKLGHHMAERHFVGKIDGSRVNVNATGEERKNLVPVDWVSEVMSTIVNDPSLHGQTYHLTPRVPIKTRLMRDVIEEVVGSYGLGLGENTTPTDNRSELEELFFQHMEVYQSYWKDDPQFDSSNTIAAVPHLPCPHVDREMLTRLSQAAIDKNFSWRDPKVDQANLAPVIA